MQIPSLDLCLSLMDDYGMLANIRHHSLVVASLSEEIRLGLAAFNPDQPQADQRLVITGALLHDIAKTPCLHEHCNHAELGAQICQHHGFPELAEIVADHVRLRDFDPERYKNGRFTATEIVYYADKRVLHHHVVSLEKRLEDILERYSFGKLERAQLIRENFNSCVLLEQYLFRWLPFSPEQLFSSSSQNLPIA